jgi:hypothetical protein
MYGQVLDEKIVNFFCLGLAASVQLFEMQNDAAIGEVTERRMRFQK